MNRRFIQIAFAASAVLFFARLSHLVWTNAVNVPFLDQWDVMWPFFKGEGLWAAFRFQHGPHRQGLGAIVIALSNGLSGWNMRVLSLVTTCVLFAAFVVAVRVRVVLYGPLRWWDLLVPAMFFRLSQFESVLLVPNPAHGAVPLVLILATCLTLASDGRLLKLILLPMLAFVVVHTGFGLILVPVLFGVLVLQGVGEWRAERRSDLRFTVGTVVAVVLLSLPFLIGYKTSSHMILPCPEGTSPDVLSWIGWPIAMVNRYFGMSDTGAFSLAVGALVFILPALVAIRTGLARGWLVTTRSGPAKEWAAHVVPVVLIGFSLLFSLISAPARICGGLYLAQESRYVTHMIPFALGLYFFLLLLANGKAGDASNLPAPVRSRAASIGLAVSGTVLAFFVLFGSSGQTEFDRVWIERDRLGKTRWAGCVVEGGSAAQCEAYANYVVFPRPADLEERIEYLRVRRLSLFSED